MNRGQGIQLLPSFLYPEGAVQPSAGLRWGEVGERHLVCLAGGSAPLPMGHTCQCRSNSGACQNEMGFGPLKARGALPGPSMGSQKLTVSREGAPKPRAQTAVSPSG